MFKFAAQSITDLMSDAHNAGRLARKVEFVTFVECANGTWCELDGLDASHAELLGITWVDVHNARGASCYRVDQRSGAVFSKTYFRHYEELCFE